MADPLFHPGATHVVVTCWQCRREVTLYPGDVPDGIETIPFQLKAKCSACGARSPHAVAMPKVPNRWR